jgi:membrane protein required for colicin V production
MSQFDLLALALLGVSGAVGFVRGAAREVFALVALIGAAVLAVVGLPVFRPLVGEAVGSGWVGTAVTLIGVFLIAFIALRLIGAGITRQMRASEMLGFLDRSLGLLIGLGRGMIVLGALYLLFTAITPVDMRPRWITSAATWPAAGNMGRLILHVMPHGFEALDRLRPAVGRAFDEASDDRTATDRYEAPSSSRPEPSEPDR